MWKCGITYALPIFRVRHAWESGIWGGKVRVRGWKIGQLMEVCLYEEHLGWELKRKNTCAWWTWLIYTVLAISVYMCVGVWLWAECGAGPSDLCPEQSYGPVAQLGGERKTCKQFTLMLSLLDIMLNGRVLAGLIFLSQYATQHFSVLAVPEYEWWHQLGD